MHDGVILAPENMTIYEVVTLSGEWLNDEMNKITTIDMANVKELDTAGIQLLLRLNCSSKKSEKRIELINIPEQVLKVFKTFNIENQFLLREKGEE